MALTPEQFSQKLEKAINALDKRLPDLIDENALNQKALMRARVTQEGLNVDPSGNEEIFPEYSTGYEKKREEKGLNVTPNRLIGVGSNKAPGGDMLRKLNIVDRQLQKGKYTVTLGGTDSFAKDKLSYNAAHYGDILKPSKQEEKIMMDAYLESVAGIINDELGK